MSSISLCVIAKNESAMLPEFFNSIGEAVDEIIFLDTGSSDNSVEIAIQAGAKIFHHIWQDDFANARNTALAHAQGEWILILDCDERLEAGAADQLRRVCSGSDFDVGMLPLYTASCVDASIKQVISGGSALAPPTYLPRLIRRDAALEWRGRIHESISQWVEHGGKVVKEVNVAIAHYGRVPDIIEAKQKVARNMRLLKIATAETPNNPDMWRHLASEQLTAGQPEMAWRSAVRGWEALLENRNRGDRSYSTVPLATVLLFTAIHRGELKFCVDVLEHLESWSTTHPNISFLRGIVLENLPKHEKENLKARDSFLEAIDLGKRAWHDDIMPGILGWKSWVRVGATSLLLDDWELAHSAFTNALKEQMDLIEAKTGLVEACIGIGEMERAFELVTPLLKVDQRDPWILAAFALRNLGLKDECAELLHVAVQRNDLVVIAPHRLDYLELLKADLGFHKEAAAG